MAKRYVVVAVAAAVVLFVLLPATRRLLPQILPLGRSWDDILFWVVVTAVVLFFLFDKTIGKRRRQHKQRLLEAERKRLLGERIDLLLDYMYEWVRGEKPERSLMYAMDPAPETLKRHRAVELIVLGATDTMNAIRSSGQVELEELNTVYSSLVGNPVPDVTWMQLQALLKGQAFSEPLGEESRQLVRLQWRHRGDWHLSEFGSRSPKQIIGALGYLMGHGSQGGRYESR